MGRARWWNFFRRRDEDSACSEFVRKVVRPDNVDGRRVQVHARDRPRRLLAICFLPTMPKPVGRIETFGVLCRQNFCSFPCDAAERGIDERLEMHGLGVRGGQPIGAVNGGVCGHSKKQQFAGAREQDFGGRAPAVWRRRLRDEALDERFELAQPAQGLVRDGLRETCVARGQIALRQNGVLGRVQRPVPSQDFGKDRERRGPGRMAGCAARHDQGPGSSDCPLEAAMALSLATRSSVDG